MASFELPTPDRPDDATAPLPGYRRHLAAALLALALFVALYLGMVGWLLWTAYALWQKGWAHFLLGGAPIGLLVVFLASGLFAIRRMRTPPAALEVGPEQEPELLAFVHRVADEVGAPRPYRVLLVPEVTAAVAYDVAFHNLVVPTQKNLIVGLGLVNAVTLDEFRAVLAHEFGHFAQGATRVGPYTYVAGQVVSHLVGHRGRIDQLLSTLSVMDVRIAWIGWILRLIVWSVRAVLESAFHLFLRLQRALLREMEFQADLAAVRVSGSDSLVHALSRLVAADEAFSLAAGLAHHAAGDGRRATDLYALQSRAHTWLRQVRTDPSWGVPPPVPADGAGHRVFRRDMAVVPQMWSTHPSNPDREENAKRRYTASPLDPRSPWLLFRDPAATRREATARWVAAVNADATEDDDLVARLEDQFRVPFADPRYHGCYLGRSAVRSVRDPAALVGDTADRDPAAIGEALEALYPPTLPDLMRSLREHVAEEAQLRGLQDGLLEAPGGVLRFRGRELGRAGVAQALEEVRVDLERARTALTDHDRAARTAHRRAAEALGRGWPALHDGLLRLLHLVEHVEADLDDALDLMGHVHAVITADHHVSASEARRMLVVAAEADTVLRHARRLQVRLHPPLVDAPRTLAEVLPDAPGFPSPNAGNLGQWLPLFARWAAAVSSELGGLRGRVLSALLEAEDTIAAAFRADDPDVVPDAATPPELPDRWPRRALGDERPRTDRLGWWDRFQLADGAVATTARLACAGGILFASTSVAGLFTRGPTLTVVNGLTVPVSVRLAEGASPVVVEGGGRAEVEIEVARLDLTVTDPAGGRVAVDQRAVSRSQDLVLGVGCWWLEYTIRYGAKTQPPPRVLGTDLLLVDRWNWVQEEPPPSITTSKGDDGVRRLLRCPDGPPPAAFADAVPASLAALHLRHEPLAAALRWLDEADPGTLWTVLRSRPAFDTERLRLAAAAHRITDAPCADPPVDDPRGRVLTAFCAPPGPRRDLALLEGAAAVPDDDTAALWAAEALGRADRWDAAAERIAGLPVREETTMWRTRIARRAGREAPPADELVAVVLEAERTGVTGPAPVHPYVALATGDLSRSAAPDDPFGADFDVLVGTSVGARPEQVTRALRRLPEVSTPEVLVLGAALALRQGVSLDGEVRARLSVDRRTGRFLSLLEGTPAQLPPLVDSVGRLGSAAERGTAYAVACVRLGDACPESWRHEARTLSFPWERPWLGPPGAGPADPR